MVFFNLYCFEISMQNLTDNVIRNAIRLRLGKFSKPFSVEVLFYSYLIYRYLGFLILLVKDILTHSYQKEISIKEGKVINIGKSVYGFKNKYKLDLTIIIPAYNVEKYIEKCILSILDQATEYSYEILVVNDCSTDSTKEILNKYLNHINIKILNLDNNKGVSAARNIAIEQSLGRYLMFLDSDDLLYDNCIQKALSQAFKYDLDVMEFSYIRFSNEEDLEFISIKSKDNANVIVDYDEIVSLASGYPWAKIFRREMFENVRFPEGVLFEDGIIHKLVFRLCTKYMHLGCVGYLYRDAPNSITKSIKNKNLVWDHLYMIKYCIDEAERLNFPIDNLFFRQIVLESGLMMKNRSFYLDSKDLLFVFSRLTDFFNQYDKGFDLTIREKIIVWCIKKKYINAWKWVAF